MARDTLIDFFDDLSHARGEFLIYDDGFRSRRYTYEDVSRAAYAFAARLAGAGLGRGDKVVLWCENRPEWIVAFWGCVLNGIVVVPVDYRASPEFLGKVTRIVASTLVLIGQDVPTPGLDTSTRVWTLHDLEWDGDQSPPAAPRVTIGRDDVAEKVNQRVAGHD